MSESTWEDPRITAFVLGEMSSDQQAAFAAEVQSDAALAAAVEEARGVTDQLQSLFANESIPPLDPERRSAIVSADASNNPSAVSLPNQPSVSPSPAQPSMSWKVPGLVLAAAAVLLLLVGIAPWLRQQDTSVAMDEPIADPMIAPSAAAGDDTLLGDHEMTPGEMTPGEMLAKDDFNSGDRDPVERGLMRGNAPVSGEKFADSPTPQAKKTGELDSAVGRDLQQPRADDKFSAEMLDDAVKQGVSPSGDVQGGVGGGGLGGAAPVQAPAGPSKAGDAAIERAKRGRRTQEMIRPQAQNAQNQNAPTDRARADVSKPASAPFPEPAAPMNAAEGSEMRQSGVGSGKKRAMSADAPFGGRAASRTIKPAIESDRDEQLADPTPAPSLDLPEKQLEEEVSEEREELKELVKDMKREVAEAPVAAVPLPADLNQLQSQLKLKQDRTVRLRTVPMLSKLPALGGFGEANEAGRGPGIPGDKFDPITDNAFIRTTEENLSTFSVDVDTASYSKTRDFLVRANQLPLPDVVRIEELVNYFDYDYKAPEADAEHPFATHVAVTSCPWNKDHRLARIALKGKTMSKSERPPCNLVFLLDTSGSMNAPNKLPLVVEGMKMLVDQLRKKDQVAITVYAGSAGLVLDSTSAKQKDEIRSALTSLGAGGSTNGGAGIALAYHTARENFIADGVNRVILCTDGDFNVGVTGTGELVRMVEEQAKGGIFLSVLGFGMGNHNDAMLEKISGRGNGNYAFIDTPNEARKVLVDQTSGTLVTIAKDVKLQVDFNPMHVSQYRLIGYENRVLAKQDFNDDKKDAGEIGAGHSVTALYELVPAGLEADAAQPAVEPSEFVTPPQLTDAAKSNVIFNLRLRYKQPNEDKSTLLIIPVQDDEEEFESSDDDVRFAAAVAGFGMQLRRSRYKGTWTLSDVLKVAQEAKGADEYELRAEFVDLVRRASSLMGEE